MSGRTDFWKERRAQGRALSTVVRQIKELMKTEAQQQGVDFQALLDGVEAQSAEARRQLAERLQESVVPLYILDDKKRPCVIGSCVLVRLDSGFFAFTAAHVIRAAGSSPLWAPPEGKGGKLLPLPQCNAHLSPARDHNDLDVGVLVLPADALGAFAQHVFLTGAEIDQEDKPDDAGAAAFYLMLGYPASNRQVKVSKVTRRIDQKSFHCATYPVTSAEYLQEDISQSDHILLDFDHEEIVVAGTPVNSPRLQGASGGGVFHISRNTNQGPLIAIATRNPRNSRLIVGTRVKHFLAMVRKVTSSTESLVSRASSPRIS